MKTPSMTNNPLDISPFYSPLSLMPNLLPGNVHPSKLAPNLYRNNSWMDPSMQPYFYYNLALNDPNQKRKNATRETTATLKAWLYEHRKNPYPTKNEKMVLAMVTKMTLTQVSTWFANARRRLKKENKLHRSTTTSKSEEEEEEEEEDLSCNDDDDEHEENEQEQQNSRLEHEEEQTIPNSSTSSSSSSSLKRKRDEDDHDEKSTSNESPTKNRPKIWSIVDVVQSNEPKRSLPPAPPVPSQIIHPYITSSMPYLYYPPPPPTGVSNSSPSDQSSSLSPVSSTSSSSSSTCSPTK